MRVKSYEKKLKKKFEKKQIETKLRDQYGITEEESKKMFQYSKILTTVILIFTLIINAVFFLAIVPFSGILSVTDAAMEFASAVLKIWDAGTIVFFCGYFAKALFETKFEKDAEAEQMPQAYALIDKVKEKVGETLDGIN